MAPRSRGGLVHFRASAKRVVFGAYVAFIVTASLLPTGPGVPGESDKLAHLAAYALMALAGMPLTSSIRSRWGVLLFILALGAILEGLQAIVPSRHSSVWDLLANTVGAATGATVWLVWGRVRYRTDRSRAR